ncbi:hypothetical protein HZA71_00055 [Candidatus Falkowbacteria bacterium]|nr:hypothetical protein [Candidatus Falkowbacteria bacterium]
MGGQFRTIDVRVSKHLPPKFYLVPQLMIDFTRDLKTRIKYLPKINDKKALKEQLEKVATEQMKQLNPIDWFRAWYEKACADFAETGKRPIECSAGARSIFIESNGNIFPCNVLKEKIGRIGKKIDSKKAMEKAKNCQKCWMLCSTLPLKTTDILAIGTMVLLQKTGLFKAFRFLQ